MLAIRSPMSYLITLNTCEMCAMGLIQVIFISCYFIIQIKNKQYVFKYIF